MLGSLSHEKVLNFWKPTHRLGKKKDVVLKKFFYDLSLCMC